MAHITIISTEENNADSRLEAHFLFKPITTLFLLSRRRRNDSLKKTQQKHIRPDIRNRRRDGYIIMCEVRQRTADLSSDVPRDLQLIVR